MAYYALGYMICFPLTHFSTALATTLFRKFSAQNRINRQVFIVNSTFVVVSVLIIIWLREFIILFLFSERYAPVTDLIIPLAMAFGFAGLSKPFTLYLMARKYGKVVRNISVIVPLIHIGMAWYIIPVYGINGAAWIAAMVYFLDLLLYMISYIRILPGESRK